MSYWMPRLGEGVRALVVLALVFLNFGHAPLAAAADLVPAWAVATCGAPVADGGPAQAPVAHQCDVCLLGAGFGLPPAPPVLILPRGEPRLSRVAVAVVMPAAWHYGLAQPRAPPAI